MNKGKILYLGLEVPPKFHSFPLVHFPIIKIVSRSGLEPDIQQMLAQLPNFTHFIFTSKSGVRIFLDFVLPHYSLHELQKKPCWAVGLATAELLRQKGLQPCMTAREETAEGLVIEIEKMELKNAYVLWPHSSLSRPILPTFFQSSGIAYFDCVLYDTIPNLQEPLPNLKDFGEIVFTSPSTIDAFLKGYGEIPGNIRLSSIGPITEDYLLKKLQNNHGSLLAQN